MEMEIRRTEVTVSDYIVFNMQSYSQIFAIMNKPDWFTRGIWA